MRAIITRASTVAATLAVATLALTACTGGAEAEAKVKVTPQTTAEACDALSGALESGSQSLAEISLGDAADPEKALAALDDMITGIQTAADDITNKGVQVAFEPVLTAFTEYGELIRDLSTDERADDPEFATEATGQILESAQTLSDAGAEFAEFCAS